MSLRFTLALSTLSAAAILGSQLLAQTPAQTQEPSAPAPQAAAQSSSPAASGRPQTAPGAPASSTPPPFPLVDRANFTATTPSEATVNSFLKASWGYDPNRVWQIQAIQKTPVQGLSKVVVLVEEKGGQQQKPAALGFFVLPDQTHLITGDQVLPFGADPFAAYRKILQNQADGPSKGSTSKSLMLVEFSDLQCPHCKEAQPTIQKLLADYPNAHYVYENFPLEAVHPEAMKAAEYGTCVAQTGGNDAFFKFADNVFANQDKLTPEAADATLKAAVTAAGQDPTKVSTCAASPQAKTKVQASMDLGKELSVNQTPTLYVNGRGLPLSQAPYETLKQIIDYQISMDGVTSAK